MHCYQLFLCRNKIFVGIKHYHTDFFVICISCFSQPLLFTCTGLWSMIRVWINTFSVIYCKVHFFFKPEIMLKVTFCMCSRVFMHMYECCIKRCNVFSVAFFCWFFLEVGKQFHFSLQTVPFPWCVFTLLHNGSVSASWAFFFNVYVQELEICTKIKAHLCFFSFS